MEQLTTNEICLIRATVLNYMLDLKELDDTDSDIELCKSIISKLDKTNK